MRGLTTELKTELALSASADIPYSQILHNVRHARYDFLCGVGVKNVDAFAVGDETPTNDPEADTFPCMNLVAAVGSTGFAGMKPVRPLEAERESRRCGENVDDAPTLFLISPLLVWPIYVAKRVHMVIRRDLCVHTATTL